MTRLAFLLFALAASLSAADEKTAGDKTPDARTTAASYRETANRLIDAALSDDAGLQRLEYLCYRICSRVSGSPQLDQAIAWSLEEMKRAGLDNVRTIPVKVPHWVRGRQSAEMLEPLQKPLFILGLGNSTGTPREGITADVVAI